MAVDMRREVLVIGAGPAGLCAAYYLQQAGIAFHVVDRAPVVGSTWANLYPSLQLNTLAWNSHLPGEHMPLRFGPYPMGTDYYAYLKRYAERHHFPITLNTEVTRVSPQDEAWCVESIDLVSGERRADLYAAVIVATGRFSNPYLPPLPGMDTFTGKILHARDFHDPNAYGGQRVMVVGNGPSGGDIAAALANAVPAPQYPILLAIRSDVLVARKYPFGLPHSVWQLLLHPLPERIRKPLVDFTVYRGYRGMKRLPIKFAPNRTDRLGTSAPVRGRELIDALERGQVFGTAGLAGFEGQEAILLDGSRHGVDTVIFCTGYRPALGYLDVPFETDKDGWMVREIDPVFGENGMEMAGYPGLYLVGRYYRGFGAMYNFRQEARIAVEQIKRRFGRESA